MNKEIKVTFAPGCFDSFEGSQEELDELVAEIQNMLSNTSHEELKRQSRLVDLDEALENDPELLEMMKKMSGLDKRNLQ